MALAAGLICLDEVRKGELQDSARNPNGLGVLEALLEHVVMNVGIKR